MYTSYLMKVTSVFTWQKGLATINSLGSHNTPSCFVTIKSWSQASNQNLLCLDRMFFPLWNITGWKSMWPHPSCPSPLFVLPSLCSSRWIDLLNAVGGKKKKAGHSWPSRDQRTPWNDMKILCRSLLLGLCLILQEVHDLPKGHLSIY